MRLVVTKVFYKEIKEAFDNDPDPSRITAWTAAVNGKMKALSKGENLKYAALADKWNKDGPPMEVKRE